ncbi:MAG TPA: PQQ-binding-like beta-propeller repeat protein [Limnochordia bacterium]
MKRMRLLAVAAMVLAPACLETFTRPAIVGPPIARLAIGPDSALLAGHTLALQVKAWDAAGQEVPPSSLIWESADSGALPVDQQGVVSAPAGSTGGDVAIVATAVGRGVSDTLVVHIAVPGEVKWHVALGYLPEQGGPAEGLDGSIYVLGDMHLGVETGTLYAISPQGQVQWSHVLTNVDAFNYPIVGSDGVIYVVGQYVYAFEPDGTLKWSITSRPSENPPNVAASHSGAIAADGSLYAAMGCDLLALRGATGDTLWQGPRAPDCGWLLPPTISVDGRTAYIKNTSDPTYVFRTATGAIAFSIADTSIELSYGVGPALAGSRLVIPDASHLQEADTNGTEFGVGPDVGLGISEPAIAADGTGFVQVPNRNGLKAFGPGASLLWQVGTPDYRTRWTWYGGPALAAGGILYLAGIHGFYSAQFSPTGATPRWQYPPAGTPGLVFVGAPLIGMDGTVYSFTSCDFGRTTQLPCSDELYSFWEDKPVDPDSPWPMWRHDARRSGQADR